VTEVHHEIEAPPRGEDVHLPGPSLVPLLNAFGVALALAGLAIGTFFSVVGLVIFLITLVQWIRDTRRDVEALPLDHH
jgi:hypothetical protein